MPHCSEKLRSGGPARRCKAGRAPAWVLIWALLVSTASAQRAWNGPGALARERGKSGAVALRAFSSVVKGIQDSVVRLDVDGKPAALGTVIDTNGLVLTKASELSTGKLTCKLSTGQTGEARLVVGDEENDLALVRVLVSGLKPIQWATGDVSVGQWAITPGIDPVPAAVGIVSVPPRKIPPKRVYLGVQLDFSAPQARIAQIMAGLGAEKAGLKPGDIILTINKDAVETSEELVTALRKCREGQTVQLRVQRDEEEFDTSVQMMIPKLDRRWPGLGRWERMNRLGGELSRRAEGFSMAIQHDAVLQPWQCGGPLLDVEGKAIGLNIARAGRVASYALPAGLVKQLVAQLQATTELPVGQEEAPVPGH